MPLKEYLKVVFTLSNQVKYLFNSDHRFNSSPLKIRDKLKFNLKRGNAMKYLVKLQLEENSNNNKLKKGESKVKKEKDRGNLLKL